VHVQGLISVVKMVTVLEAILPKRGVLLCVVCGQKDSMRNTFINKCILFTVRIVCRVKQFITGSINPIRDIRKFQMLPDQVALF
jgi:hypothetical protein